MSRRGGRVHPSCDFGIQLGRAVLVHSGVSLNLCIRLSRMLTCFAPRTLQRRTPSARLVCRRRHPCVHFVDASRSLCGTEARRPCTCTCVGRCSGDLDSTVRHPCCLFGRPKVLTTFARAVWFPARSRKPAGSPRDWRLPLKTKSFSSHPNWRGTTIFTGLPGDESLPCLYTTRSFSSKPFSKVQNGPSTFSGHLCLHFSLIRSLRCRYPHSRRARRRAHIGWPSHPCADEVRSDTFDPRFFLAKPLTVDQGERVSLRNLRR